MTEQEISHSLLDNISTGLVIVDQDRSVSYVNAAAQAMLQLSESRILGKKIARVLQWDEASELDDIENALRTGSGFTIREARLRPDSDNSAVVDCAITPFQRQPESGISVVLELQPIDRWLRISREEGIISAQQSSQALLRGLAHEIKNPLGGLRGAAQLLDRELPADGLRDYTRIIIEEADRLRNLVDRMLAPGRDYKPQSLNLHEVLEYVRQLLEAENPDIIRLERDYDPSIPDIHGDRDRLIQAVLNVVRNALQAGDDQEPPSTVTIRTRTVRQFSIGVHRYRLVARIDIVDNGPGVPEELAESLFFPMISGSADGTGLGLSIAQSILNQHRGLIEFESEPGNTVFSMYIPLDPIDE